jgi:hypothetical protein
MPQDNWLFDEPRNVAVFTTRHVMVARHPILYVYHDQEDGAWQFHSSDEITIQDAMVVALSEIVDIDPTVMELADLPLGWMAWRNNVNEPWQRKVNA